MMNRIRKSGIVLSRFALITLATLLLQGCVHEFPHVSEEINVRLDISHYVDWTEYDYYIDTQSDTRRTRGENGDEWKAQYTVAVYPKGKTSGAVKRYSFTRDDLSLATFETELKLPSGDWDIYVWQDFISKEVEPPYYNVSDFKAITYGEPYRGDTNMRDAFEGSVTVSVPETIDADYVVTGEITMERPLAKYVFIATDFEDFYNDTMTRFDIPATLPAGEIRWEGMAPETRADILKEFGVVAKYPWYMPSVYDMFTQKVTDSRTGVYYDALINPINSQEAIIATDYVFINHHESGAQVQLGLRTPDGDLYGLTSVITVPLLRGRITYIRGRFLTASAGSGLDIDFSFSGDFDIFIP